MTAKLSPKIEKQSDGSLLIKLTLTKEEIGKEYEHQISHLQTSLNLKGFRPGKIPTDIAKQHLSETEVLQQATSNLISSHYQKVVTDNNLKPVVNPKIKISQIPQLSSDCEVEITTTELPTIKLATDYLNKLKKAKNKFDELIKLSTINIPRILISSEVEVRLSQLISELATNKFTLVDYLRQRGIDLKTLQDQLEQASRDELVLQLALNQISVDQRIELQKTVEFVKNLKA